MTNHRQHEILLAFLVTIFNKDKGSPTLMVNGENFITRMTLLFFGHHICHYLAALPPHDTGKISYLNALGDLSSEGALTPEINAGAAHIAYPAK